MWLLSIVLNYQKEYNLIASYNVSYYHYCKSCKIVAMNVEKLLISSFDKTYNQKAVAKLSRHTLLIKWKYPNIYL